MRSGHEHGDGLTGARNMQPIRCSWVDVDHDLIRDYHDREWGVPTHEDRTHFEFLVLEAAQAGLSWSIVLNKREGYRRAFSQFDPEKVARYSQTRIDKLTADSGIIRNRTKIAAAVRKEERCVIENPVRHEPLLLGDQETRVASRPLSPTNDSIGAFGVTLNPATSETFPALRLVHEPEVVLGLGNAMPAVLF